MKENGKGERETGENGKRNRETGAQEIGKGSWEIKQNGKGKRYCSLFFFFRRLPGNKKPRSGGVFCMGRVVVGNQRLPKRLVSS